MWLPAMQHSFKTKSFIDVLVLDKILEYIKPSFSCEIGIMHGETLQIIDRHSEKTLAIDILFRETLHNRKFKNVEFIHADNKNDRKDVFDFIHVDGDHSFQMCLSDLEYSKNHVTIDSIIVVDDYPIALKGVREATNQFLKHTDFEITFAGQNQIFLQNKFAKTKLQDIIQQAFNKNLQKICRFDFISNTYADITGNINFESKIKILEHYL